MVKFMKLKVTGIDLEIKNLNELKKNIPKEIDSAMEDYMYRLLNRAKELCPVKTGALRDSLNIGKVSENHWFLEDGVPYGAYQEYGFVSKGGQFVQNPFVMPAYYSTFPPIIRL